MRIHLLLLVLVVSLQAGARERADVLVAYHLSTADEHRQQIALLNMKNHIEDLREQGKSASIKMVLDGDGVALLMRAQQQLQVQQLLKRLRSQGVDFLAERQPLQSADADWGGWEEALRLVEGRLIESSILTLVELQQQGYAYLPYPAE